MTPLRRRMIEDMQVRNLAPHTQRAYLQQVSLFSRHFGKSPDAMGPEEIRAYQIQLTHERGLSASSILVAVSAIRFLYKVTLKRTWSVDEVIPTCRKPQKLPTVLSREEVARFLDAAPSRKHQVILTLCYATGLRVSEALALTSSAIDSQRMVIRVEEGKGRKDRQVMLSPRLLDLLRRYWRAEHPQGWLFPGAVPGQPISAFAVQHACKAARRRSGLVKPVTPHSLRHAFDFIAAGDELVVTRIDRLARSIGDLQDIVRELRAKGATLKATEQPIDTSTAAGKAFLDMLGVFAEFETNLRRERQLEGIKAAKERGVYKGRPTTIDAKQVADLKQQGLGATEIAKRLNVGRASVYRVLGAA